MIKSRLKIILIFVLTAINIFAQQISNSEAVGIAAEFFGPNVKFDLAYTGGKLSSPDYYVFNENNGNGYVIIAGDRRMPDLIPVYSKTGNFFQANLHEGFRSVLDNYSRILEQKRKGELKNVMNKSKITPLAAVTTVGPLLGEIAWDQFAPYNLMCPVIGVQNAPTGCGATASAQVLKYHSWPLKGTGSKGGINYAAQTYNWDLMLPKYDNNATDEQKNEVAKIMYHLGVSMDMNYSTDGSGTSLKVIPSALSTYFSYSKNYKIAYRISYTDTDWLNLIKKEIDLNRPIIYSGNSSTSGHLFVIDGYSSDKKIHVNFGWGGYSNAYLGLPYIQYINSNAVAIGVYPNNKVVANEDLPGPQVSLLSAINCSKYTPQKGEAFNIGVRMANYNDQNYIGNIGIALFKGTVMQNTPIKQQSFTFNASVPAIGTSQGIQEYDIQFTGVSIPAATTDGTYKLRFVAQQNSLWYPVQYIVQDIVPELDVNIKNGVVTFSHPLTDNGSNLELIEPIDVNVASNRAKIRFSVINKDEFYTCKNTDIYVMSNPNTGLVPTVWTKLTISELNSGMIQNFEITDFPVPPGANVSSCRFYIAYSRAGNQPLKGREVSASPMQPLNYNFVNYNIPKEVVIKNLVFRGTDRVPIPGDYKRYNAEGIEDPNVWKYTVMGGNATAGPIGAKLVTSPMLIDDENYVLEWRMFSMYNINYRHKIYVSTDGQNFSNFVTPVYDKVINTSTTSKEVARYSLAEYINKNVYIAFEATDTGETGLSYFKLLNIKTPKDVALQSINIPGTMVMGEPMKIKMSVKNKSASTVKNIKCSYTINGNKVEEDIVTDIPFSDIGEIEFNQPAILNGKAGDSVPVTVSVKIEGEDESLLADNTMTNVVMLSNFTPRKGVLAYKTTKLNCYGCTTSYAVLDQIEESFPEYISAVEIWRDGSFKTIDFPGYMVGTTPSLYLNTAWTNSLAIYTDIQKTVQSMATPADISATSSFESETSRKLNIQLKANFAMPATGDYKLGAIIIENNVKNIDGQISGTAPSGDKLVKNHIPIGTIAVNDAPEGSVISNPEAKEYTYNCSFTVPAELAYKYRKDNLQVIAVLYGPKGQILNSALDCYYVKLRETNGLTFASVDGYPALKQIYDLHSPNESQHISITNYRATVPAGGTYKFRIYKDNSWSGFRPKVIVNKGAKSNAFTEVVIEPDKYGIYTITDMHNNYNIEFEQVPHTDTRSFSISYNGNEISDGDLIEVTGCELVSGKYNMKFSPEVTNTSDVSYAMRMKKEVISEATNTSNEICWDQCMTPDDEYANCAVINPWETQNPYGELCLNAYGYPVLGTSVVKYTFMTSYKEDPTVSVEVHYVNSIFTGVEGVEYENGISIDVKGDRIEIKTSYDMDTEIFDISGRLIRKVQLVQGINFVTGLPKGAYIINNKKIIL